LAVFAFTDGHCHTSEVAIRPFFGAPTLLIESKLSEL
jgi:hypothetical protein